MIFHEKMARSLDFEFFFQISRFLYCVPIDNQDLKMIILNKNSYLVDNQIWLSFRLDNYYFSYITKLKEKEHSLWAL
jgi:hypothetical protein